MKNKIKNIVAKILIAVIILNVLPAFDIAKLYSIYAASPRAGSGTEASPYIITSAAEVDGIRNNLNTGVYYQLDRNIDMSSMPNFVPIGTKASPFRGRINGAGFTISSLKVDAAGKDEAGFIGSNQGVIQNIGFANLQVKGKDFVGLVGQNDGEGIIQNVHTSGSVAGQNSVSGIAGMNYGTISNTYTNCNVYGNNNVGGIAGINSNIIRSVYTVGNVRANKNPGSIAGNDAFGGEITNAYSNVAPLVGIKEPEAVETNVAVKTLAELKNISNYTGFVGSEWKIQPTYPYATQAGVNKVIYNNDVEYSGGDGTVIAPYKITIKEELQKINKNLNSNYIIEKDLNMIGIDFTPIGTEVRYFTGSINGNNKTVSNLNINKPGQNKVAFVAYNDGIIEKIGFPAINVVGEKDVAGVVAYNGGSVSEVFTTGNITGNGNVSGIIGTNEAKGNVKNVYSLASVRGQVNVAGIIGHNLGTAEAIYARGPKGDTTTNVANLIGQNGTTAKVTRAYHSSNSGIAQNKGIGQEEATSTDMYAKTDLELQQQATYKSWNFTDVWAIDTNTNSGFPYFKSIVNVEVISITLPETSKNLEKTNTYQLVPTILPANATVKDVIYETSNPAVATVSSTGLVTAVENGSAVIKVTSTGSGLSATCDVLVAAKTNGVTLKDEKGNIIANTGSIALDSLTSLGLEVITDPVDAQVACEWLSDKTSLVRVEGTGRNIRIYAEDVIGASTDSTYLNLTVTPTNGAAVNLSVLVSVTQRVKTLTTDKETYTLDLTNAGQDVSNIVATILPANAVDKSLSFTVADPTVVKLEAGANAETKKITGLKPGQTTVTIQTTDPDLKPAISKTVNVIVKKEPKTVEILNNGAAIKDKQLLLCEKINGKITHKFNAEDTTDNAVVWSIDNLNVATIDSFGVLTPVRSADNTVVEGKANLTVTTTSSAYAKISDTVNITTEQHVETITMNRHAYTRQAGNVVETGKFFVKTVGPKEDIAKQKIKWTSADENIVTVTNDSDPGTPRGAELTFKNNAGSTTITATIIDGVHDNVSVTSEVHVTRLPNTVELDKPDQMEVYVSDIAPTRITAKVTPGDVTNKNVSWEVKAYDPNGTLLNTNDRATETPGTDASGLPYLELTPKIKGKLEIRVRAAGLSTVYKDIVVEIKERPASVALDSVNLTLATEDITVASTVYKKDHKLTATIYPAESSYKGVVYESLDPAIATVDALGNVSALKGGKTKIKVSSDKFPDVNIYCDVDIKQVPVGIELWDKDNKENVTNKQIEIYNDDPYKINHKFLPVDNSIFTDFATVTYKSSNELVAAVTAEGVITVKPNIKESCIVTVTSLNNKTATVTVVPKQKVTSVKLDKQTAAIKSDETLQIYAEVTPTFAYNKQVTWTTSDAAVATVDQNGLVTAVAPSLTPVTITATTVDGNFKDTCAVTVSQAATGVVIKNATTDVEITAQVDMFNTETLPLKAVVTPSGVAQDVTWSSDNLSIANVSALGVVTFVETGAGIVHITATTANGKVASIAVNAKRHVSSVSIPNKVIEIQKGETATVLATVLPENASNKAVTWSSSDPSIADIDGDGIIRGILGGTVTVTAISAENSAYTDTATVKVIAKPASMSVAEPSVVTYIGDTPKNLKYTILPVDTTDKTVTYSIDRLNIMEAKDGATAETVDISGVAVGNAVLTLTSKADSKITASCNVEVRRHPTSIKLDKTNIEIYTESIEYIKETVLETDSFDKSVTWTSSDPLVVSVDTQGKITAGTNIGTSTITATTVDGNLAASCLVTVKKLPEGVSLDKQNVTLFVGKESTEVTAKIVPDTASYQDITWKVQSGPENVRIVPNGNKITIYGEKVGLTTVRAVAVADPTRYADCVVDVKQGSESIKIVDNSTGLEVVEKIVIFNDQIANLGAVVLPDNSFNKDVTWSSADTAIANINPNGVVRVAEGGAGVVKITATSAADPSITDVVEIEARQHVSAITHPRNITITGDKPYTIKPTVLPENAYNKKVTWKLNGVNPELFATIDADTGVITPTGVAGAVSVMGTTVDQAKMVVIDIKIINKPREIKLDKDVVDLYIGDTNQIVNAEVLPADAENKAITWSLDVANIATVVASDSSKIELAPAVQGVAKLRATSSEDINIYKEITVNVKVHALSIDVAAPQVEIYTGETKNINAKVMPDNASDKQIIYTPQDPTIATVDASGNITPLKAGETIVDMKSNEKPSIINSCKVVVKQHAEGVQLHIDGKLLEDNITLDSDTMHKVEAVITPTDTTNKAVTWEVSDKTKATIDADGILTLVPKVIDGTFTITATTANGIKDTVTVTIKKQASTIALFDNKDLNHPLKKLTLFNGEFITLAAQYMPYKDPVTITRWWSTDENIATVNNGYVEPKLKQGGNTDFVTPGIVTIYAEEAGKKVGYVDLEVKQHALNLKIKLEPEEETTRTVRMKIGEERKFLVDIIPEYASDKDLYWSVDNTFVGNVDANGVYKPIASGGVMLTAISKDNARAVDSVYIESYYGPNEMVAEKSKEVIYLDEKNVEFLGSVLPVDAQWEYGQIKYTSSKPAVAAVQVSTPDAGISAKVTPLSKGKTTIRMECVKDLSIYKEIQVEVKKATESLDLNFSNIEIFTNEIKQIVPNVLPADASDLVPTYTSANANIATVDENGNVKGIAPGIVVITAATKDGRNSKTVAVTVKQKATGITLSANNLSLEQEQQWQLVPTVTPENTTDKTVTWTTSDSTIATVDINGIVTAVKSGSAVITAYTKDNEFNATCNITVTSPLKEIKFKDTIIYVYPGQRRTPELEFVPKVPDNAEVTWKILEMPNYVASVNPFTGVVSGYQGANANMDGQVTLRVTSKTNAAIFKDIKVQLVWPRVESVEVNFKTLNLDIGKQKQLLATVKPTNAVIKTVNWASADTKVATVDAQGRVIAKYPGNTKITVYSEQDPTIFDVCDLTVNRPTYALSLDDSQVGLSIGDMQELNLTMTPANISEEEILWEVVDQTVATVTKTGEYKAQIKALKNGTTKVRASLKSTPTIFIEADILIEEKLVQSVSVSPTTATMNISETKQFTAEVLPVTVLDKTVTWESSDVSLATVDSNGLVTAKLPGTVTISAKSSKDNTKVGSATVTINRPNYTVNVDKTEVSIHVHEEATLNASLMPANISAEEIVWSNSNANVISFEPQVFNTQLKIKGVTAGTAQVTAALKSDPSKFKTVNIYVDEAMVGDEFIKLAPGSTYTMGDLPIEYETDGTTVKEPATKYIKKVQPNTELVDFLKQIDCGAAVEVQTFEFKIENGVVTTQPLRGTVAKTKMLVRARYASGNTDEVQISVAGDANGDGKIAAIDVAVIKSIIAKKQFVCRTNLMSCALGDKSLPAAIDVAKIKSFIAKKITTL